MIAQTLDDSQIAPPAHADLSDVEVLLQDVAMSIAFQLTPHNPQYVIKRLLPNDCYKIISGMPSFSERHGIGEVGHLHTPVPKKALLHAISRNEIVTIDDAPHDDAVNCYMSGHIMSKKIQSVAVVPIGRDGVRWLIVLDKVPPSSRGFSPQEREHLEACKRSTERSLVHLSEEIVAVNQRTLQKALNEYAHLFRNPLTVIGGFAKRLRETRDPVRIELYSDIIQSQSRRLEEDFSSFMALVGYLFPGGHPTVDAPLGRYLAPLLADPCYELRGDRRAAECAVRVPPEVVTTLFDEMRRYLQCSAGSNETVRLEVRKDPTHAAVVFYSTAFQEFKEDNDVRFAIFRQVAYQIDGDCCMGKGWCQVSLPLSEARPQ
jgi:hypothetical protein